MAFEDGDNFVDGSILSYQEANRLKNHFRGAAEPTNPQPGMVFSRSTDDKLFHAVGTSVVWDEILQATGSFDVTPMFDNIVLDVDTGALSDPPTAAELAGIFGSDPGEGFVGLLVDSASASQAYIIFFSGGTFYYVQMTTAV